MYKLLLIREFYTQSGHQYNFHLLRRLLTLLPVFSSQSPATQSFGPGGRERQAGPPGGWQGATPPRFPGRAARETRTCHLPLSEPFLLGLSAWLPWCSGLSVCLSLAVGARPAHGSDGRRGLSGKVSYGAVSVRDLLQVRFLRCIFSSFPYLMYSVVRRLFRFRTAPCVFLS